MLAQEELSNNNNNNECWYPEGVWGLKDYYLWDNWIADSRKYDGKMHRYSLCAPKYDLINNKNYGPNDRHDLACVRHSYSIDNGIHWIDCGEIFSKNMINKHGNMLWSGCCIIKENENNNNNSCQYITMLTCSKKDVKTGNYIQRIGVSRSNNGYDFSDIEICCEYTPNNEHGYDMSNSDGEGYCWRDPYLYKDPITNEWHLLWGAKLRDNNTNELKTVVGHAICKNNNLFNKFEIVKPILIPFNYGQCELPAIFYYNHYYYLFMCGQSAATQTCAYCIFVSKEIDNNYKLIYSSCKNNDYQSNHFVNKYVYALTIFETHDNNNNEELPLKAVGFYDVKMANNHENLVLTNTPIIDIIWNNNISPPIPTIKYNQIVFNHKYCNHSHSRHDNNNNYNKYDDKNDVNDKDLNQEEEEYNSVEEEEEEEEEEKQDN
jgi:hypothetical protein